MWSMCIHSTWTRELAAGGVVCSVRGCLALRLPSNVVTPECRREERRDAAAEPRQYRSRRRLMRVPDTTLK